MTAGQNNKLVVTIADIRAAKHCSRGARLFFQRHGLDWSDFLKNGIDAEELLATGDHLAINVVEVARGRQQ